MKVEDVMTRDVEVVERSTALKDVARLLSLHAISGVPVVEHGVPVGVVSESDLVAKEQESESETVRARRRLRRQRPHVDAVAAADVMTAPPVTVRPQTSAVGAAWLMTEHDIDRLLVVENDRLVGIVTRGDLVRAFGRSDEQIRAEIVGDILPALGVSANDVAVAVDDGIVLLAGEVEDELEARCLPHAVRSVLGVVEVRCELTARHRHRPPLGVFTH